jgi:hypothetical protein
MFEIQTKSYVQEKTILIDGKTWTMKPLGAGDELAMSQMQRRASSIQKKVDTGEATDEDLDKLEVYETRVMQVFEGIFKDGSEDNSEVREWITNTPFSVIQAVIEEITKQSQENKLEEDGKEVS